MALAIDITNGHGHSNEARRYLLSKKSKVILYLHSFPSIKAFNRLHITNKTERFSFKSGRAMCVMKLTKTNWLVVLQ